MLGILKTLNPMVAGFTRIGIEFCLAWALYSSKADALGL
jgi:hypothetical protein